MYLIEIIEYISLLKLNANNHLSYFYPSIKYLFYMKKKDLYLIVALYLYVFITQKKERYTTFVNWSTSLHKS